MAAAQTLTRDFESEDRAHLYREARSLFWRAWRVTDIADELDIPRTTVQSWCTRDKWREAPSMQVMESSAEVRFATLVAKEQKTGQDFKEIDLLGRQVERFARVRKYEQEGGHEG